MTTSDKITVLYIDDEANNLISFKASFRFDYNVLLANNADEAFAHLKERPEISIILSDQKMPDKTGVELFEQIRIDFPNPVRILITGYADIESVIDAINKGHIFRYIKKPWEEDDIKSAIEEGYKFYLASSMLAIRNVELQKAYDELDKFAYSATHDMRGPILSALGLIELAKASDDAADVKGMLGMMENAMLKLDNYIQNIHDYYSIRRGEVNVTEVSFDDIAKDMQGIYDVTGKLANVTFTTNVIQNETFRSHDVSLKIMLNNLLSNAFKYQQKTRTDKKVDLTIEVSKGTATIKVKDNGIGIPEASIDHVFNMFYRATTEEVGAGFGLYNVKDALNKLGGQVSVESTVNEGSTFTITLPSK